MNIDFTLPAVVLDHVQRFSERVPALVQYNPFLASLFGASHLNGVYKLCEMVR